MPAVGIQTAQMKFKRVRVINITASEDVLLQRLCATLSLFLSQPRLPFSTARAESLALCVRACV